VEGLGTMEEEVALVVAEEVLVPVAEDVEVKVRALHLLLPNLN
jgi:hypothetical protein